MSEDIFKASAAFTGNSILGKRSKLLSISKQKLTFLNEFTMPHSIENWEAVDLMLATNLENVCKDYGRLNGTIVEDTGTFFIPAADAISDQCSKAANLLKEELEKSISLINEFGVSAVEPTYIIGLIVANFIVYIKKVVYTEKLNLNSTETNYLSGLMYLASQTTKVVTESGTLIKSLKNLRRLNKESLSTGKDLIFVFEGDKDKTKYLITIKFKFLNTHKFYLYTDTTTSAKETLEAVLSNYNLEEINDYGVAKFDQSISK